MGHEIALLLQDILPERMSHNDNKLKGIAADIFLGGTINRTRNTVGQNTGLDIFQLGGYNPFGRKQETEADYLGLIFSSLSDKTLELVKPWSAWQKKIKVRNPSILKYIQVAKESRI